MDILALLSYLIGLAVVAVIILCVVLYLMSDTYPSVTSHESEDFFSDPSNGKKLPFPTITDKPSKSLTVVVPSYNEEKRLPLMLEESLSYLEERAKKDYSFTYEMIIVDDGSKDKTTEVAMGYSKKFGCDKVRVLTLAWNRGKGGAVKMGMFRARGKLLLFADADGATTFSEYGRVEASSINSCLSDVVSTSDCESAVPGSIPHKEIQRTAHPGFHLPKWIG